MTLKMIEGFEVYQTPAALSKKWNAAGAEGGNGVVSGSGFSVISGSQSTWAARLSGVGGNIDMRTPNYSTPFRTCVVGMRFRGSALAEGTGSVIQFQTGTTTHLSFYYFDNGNGTFRFDVFRGVSLANQLMSSAAIPDNEWVYLEFKVFIDNTTGTVEILRNGVSMGSATNVDTQANANPNMDRVRIAFACGSGGNTIDLDDIYILDGDGGERDDYLGDVVVDGRLPNADNDTNWTPQGGVDNYVEVDELGIADDDTTYVSTQEQDSKEIYDFPDFDLAGSGDYLGVMLSATMRLTTTGSRNTAFVIKEAVSDDEEEPATVAVDSTSYETYSVILEQNPHTSADFTTNDLDDSAFGVRAIT